MTTEPQTSTLRRRGGDAAETTDSASSKLDKPKTRTPQELMTKFPDVKPILPSTAITEADPSHERTKTAQTASTLPSSNNSSRSVGGTVLHYLAKPFSFLVFVLIHLCLEIMTSARTMKTMVQVFFLPHLFPASPELVRILRKDLGQPGSANNDHNDDHNNSRHGTKISPAPLLAKLPKHLAVILPADSTSDDHEEEWHETVAQLAQWSVASGIKCLSVMRNDPLSPPLVQYLQERINDEMAEFYKEEPRSVPVALVRTLSPVDGGVHGLVLSSNGSSRLVHHGGKPYDLDIVILSEADGHDRLAEHAKVLAQAALENKIESQDISVNFLDKQLTAELSEPELLIIYKDDLELSSYPPWHTRLTEIYHHPDQAVIPKYTMFLQALHRYAKCEQRFGK
ncbi:dehydrodolichyl diphosphate syntase complex subunit NUS1 [Entomortierella parvispora]|uniref:ditrans,polycis-polyprenyl diphosphate synthase [(2E,6E)-farnesyldiphosphate specific] n=1 Tax=Entomortierella parvispora TaxID=205924 RepID=A0A9P3LT01_9FUNG|nr:dehydrodolichyl diphosphate syntase complex subunit NUS1 [Entomortierella parvispora]